MWNDDFHHSARVALTGRREAYYTDYLGGPQEFVSLVKRGFLYQGQRYLWQQKPRGSQVTSEPAPAFVFYLENHDQVANDARGERLGQLTNPGVLRAMTALLLLAPETPLLFMGQEFNPSGRFYFFADHAADRALLEAVHRGRREFLGQFPSFATPDMQAMIPDPAAPSTFERSRLERGEGERHQQSYRLYEDLLRLRREDPVIARQRRDCVDGAVVGTSAFVLRWSDDAHGDRLLVLNLGVELVYEPAPEPLLAPATGAPWRLVWSSDEPRYGGPGTVDPQASDRWRLPATSAHLFVAAPA
jgi:maltooligosyltrehalose trehalohydrolase